MVGRGKLLASQQQRSKREEGGGPKALSRAYLHMTEHYYKWLRVLVVLLSSDGNWDDTRTSSLSAGSPELQGLRVELSNPEAYRSI
jgi:hypothetical protein